MVTKESREIEVAKHELSALVEEEAVSNIMAKACMWHANYIIIWGCHRSEIFGILRNQIILDLVREILMSSCNAAN